MPSCCELASKSSQKTKIGKMENYSDNSIHENTYDSEESAGISRRRLSLNIWGKPTVLFILIDRIIKIIISTFPLMAYCA